MTPPAVMGRRWHPQAQERGLGRDHPANTLVPAIQPPGLSGNNLPVCLSLPDCGT